MSRRQTSRRGKAIRRLRMELSWSEEQLGAPHGLSGKVVHNLEQGWRQEPTRQEAEEIIAPMGLSPAALDMSDGFGRWVQAAARSSEPVSPEEEEARRSMVAAGLMGLQVAKMVFPEYLRQARKERFALDRRQADERVGHLRRLPWQARRERIQGAEDYQTWAMVERLAHESVRAAADKPAKAIGWADLALFTVPLVQGPDSRRQRLGGYATFTRANALRVGNDLDSSDAAFHRGWALWKAGEDDRFLPLDEGRPLDLEASLRREQRRFQEALDLHKRALESGSETGRFLLNQAATLEQMGEAEASIESLRQARPYIEKEGEPRDLNVLLFNLTVALLHLGRLEDAEDLLSDAREIAIRLGNELDLARTLWLAARLDSSLGRTAKAAAALEQVFEDLLVSHGLPYDAALAGMDLAVLHLEQGNTRDVMPLALRMEAVFVSLGIEREALSALLVFCEAARREEATVELARRTAEIIEKVQREQRPPRPEPGLGG